MSDKPQVIKEIEKVVGVPLHEAKPLPDLIGGIMAFKEGCPKYAINEAGELIGLNLSATGLDDGKWKTVVELLQLTSVNLKALNLSDNNLKDLIAPPGISGLIMLDVDDNPLKTPPKEITEQGNPAILNFLQQIEEQEGTVPLYEAKLLIVGEPGAGKTTLLKKLENPEYVVPVNGDKSLKSTVGVNILEGWEFPYCYDDSISFKANVWDFGGQEIQYMTHHFFLTPRALYVLVADDRKQNTEFDYWFRIIDLLGRENPEEKINVLVVLNEINHVAVTNFDLNKYREDYPGMNIRMCEVDFSVRDNRSESLVSTIQEMICSLPHIGDPLPRLWKPVREDLIARRKESPHISFDDFSAICSVDRGGKNLDVVEDQRFLSSFLHRLGVMLHYQDDDDLDNFIILRPQWAVDAVYGVMKDTRVVKNLGRFTKEDLREFWQEYSPEQRSRLLRLMLKDKFEICYQVPFSETYIAPQLLPSTRPDFQWDSTNTLKFRFQYPFMPKGLISRFIVRVSQEIAEKGKLVWKDGVLISRGKCIAQVKQGKTPKEGLEVLEIEISGPEKYRISLLEHVITQVEFIHKKSFKHITFEKMVPCNCSVCKNYEQPAFFEYTKLEQYEEEGWKEIDCSKGKLKKVSVKGLLVGVSQKDLNAVVSNIKSLLAKGKVDLALAEAIAGFPDDKNAILLNGRWNTLQDELNEGIVSYDNQKLKANEISSHILSWLDSLEVSIHREL